MVEETKTRKISIILVISVIAIFAIGLIGGYALSGAITISNKISPQVAADKVVKYINENLVQPGTFVSLISVKETNSFYNVTILYQDAETYVYVTKDGSNLILPQALINMNENQLGQQSEIRVSIDDDPVKGSPEAKITIVEFSDFQCPYCEKFWEETLPQIQKDYIDTGKIKFVYRDFPLGFHEYAQKAAEASECADDQGKFWEYHDKLYGNQESLSTTSLKQYAKDLGLDSTEFDSCLDNGKYEAEVQKDLQDGQNAGVSGTPAFFILDKDGNVIKAISGAQPYSVFKQELDAALANN